ncbi:hypothetical protein ILUMI_20994 [Ignelater luminosus]|uniref:Uncharacterized protein n=1 Tax=Ignelater luminosus TaxID=2038154 RepID=A0A8K0CH84_IGNLU|nr:hypothetical protein ILUMI_20994 [Ignelater luminosus]
MTNLIDRPGTKRCGTRYPERILDSTKIAISLMFATTADDKFLPPYIIYKAGQIYDGTKGIYPFKLNEVLKKLQEHGGNIRWYILNQEKVCHENLENDLQKEDSVDDDLDDNVEKKYKEKISNEINLNQPEGQIQREGGR